MSECKHEFEHEYSDNGPLSVMLYDGTFCSKCNKEIGEYVDELRQQLAAEQAKSAELEATIAAMHDALKEVKEDWIAYNNVKFGNGEEFGLIRPKTADLVFKALSNTAGDEYNRVKTLEKAAKRLIDESKRIWLINQEDGIEIPHLKVAIDNLQAVLGDGAK